MIELADDVWYGGCVAAAAGEKVEDIAAFAHAAIVDVKSDAVLVKSFHKHLL